MTNIAITDNNGTPGNTADDFAPTRISGDTDGDNQLDVAETWVYQATRVVTAGAYSNMATVTGNDPNATRRLGHRSQCPCGRQSAVQTPLPRQWKLSPGAGGQEGVRSPGSDL